MKPKEKSFSALVKEAAKEIPIKKGCCRHAFADALSLESKFPDDAAKMICGEDFRCPSCAMNYIRGLFTVYGNVTSPEKAYHLEFSAETEELCEALVSLLEKQGMIFHRAKRKGRFIAYIKDSEKIEDFLCRIGLNSFAFDFMNSKIVREIRNNANRQVNCDSANIEKSLNAAKKYVSVIEKLISTEMYNELPDNLKEAARLRREYPEESLVQLGMKFNPPITKSGVKHRLDSIIEFAEKRNLT